MTDPGRTAILRAARRAFALQPYDVVTLRGIAADANVSAALIVKHFGSKESLFEQVADFSEAAELLLAAPDAELGRHAVLTLVNYRRDHGLDLLVRVIFAAGSGDERALIREHFRDQVTRAFAARLTGADADLRAELITAQLLGLGAAISVNKTGPVATTDPEAIADLYAPALQALIH
ncbi:TetR/AcrR family transcriptional regulator [Kribbella sp. CWNU-51]